MAKDDFLKKEFHIGTEFGKRFNFPENIKFEYDGMTGCVAQDIAVRMAEKWEDFVVEQIVAEAIDMGISDLTVLNKPAIMNALRKQIPQKPIRDSLADRACPSCDAYIPFDALNDRIEDAPKFCKHCGQALDWGDVE